MHDLMDEEETNWQIAIKKNGISRCGAISSALKRFVFWHMIQPMMYYVVLSVYWDNLNEQGACSDGTSTTRAACEGTDPAGTWTTEASLRLPDALFVCYVVSTLSGLYFFVFALSKRIRCRCRCCSASEDSGSGDEQDPELEVEPQPEPAAGGRAAGASRRLPPQFPGGAE